MGSCSPQRKTSTPGVFDSDEVTNAGKEDLSLSHNSSTPVLSAAHVSSGYGTLASASSMQWVASPAAAVCSSMVRETRRAADRAPTSATTAIPNRAVATITSSRVTPRSSRISFRRVESTPRTSSYIRKKTFRSLALERFSMSNIK